MPRIDAITLKVSTGTTAQADVVVDGIEHRDLVLRRHHSRVYVAWPKATDLPRSTRRRLEPRIIRALDQWRDLVGGSG